MANNVICWILASCLGQSHLWLSIASRWLCISEGIEGHPRDHMGRGRTPIPAPRKERIERPLPRERAVYETVQTLASP
jgi:hypothetical protein